MVLCLLVLSACGTQSLTRQVAKTVAKKAMDSIVTAMSEVPKKPIDSMLGAADSLIPKADSLVNDLASKKDSLSAPLDPNIPDSLISQKQDSLRKLDSLAGKGRKKTVLDDVVEYKAQDSIVIEGTNYVYFYGPSMVKYTTKSLEANYMRINLDSNQVYSRYVLDSVGKPAFLPKFKDGNEEYEAKTMNYNFKTEKGFIENVTTKQGEGYLTSMETKKLADNTMFSKGVHYTTCDQHDHPHFYINIQKAKIRPGKNIVAGPANLVLLDVPLPLGLPFGFFPFTKNYSSGILMPSFGEDYTRGFFLNRGGYYFAFNDYVDLAIMGELYTKGSWGVSARSNYRKRYKYNGSFDFNYLVTVQGDKYVGDYSKATDLRLAWTHTQDPKADPVQNFSASVNFSTSRYNHNSLNQLYNPMERGNNTKSSSVNYSRSFPGTPWRLSGSFSIAQRSQDSTINLTLPDLSISMSRIFPFKRKNAVGSERWYEKIGISYSGQIRSSVTAKENTILKKNFLRDWDNGVSHRIPVSASYKVLDNIDLTFNADYNERWYSKRIQRKFDAERQSMVPSDTVYGFNRVYNFNMGVTAGTTLYGFYKPLGFLGKKMQMIRHMVTPHVSFSYSPDFGNPRWGFWKQYNYIDQDGNHRVYNYSPYEGMIFGVPGAGKTAAISFGAENTIEGKWKTMVKDTLNTDDPDAEVESFKKISLIENFSWNWSYNMAADSFKWSDISTSLRLKFTDQLGLSLSGSFDPYVYKYTVDKEGRVNAYPVDQIRLFHGKGIGSLRSTGTSFSFTLNPEKVSQLFSFLTGKKDDKNDEKKDDAQGNANNMGQDQQPPGGSIDNDNPMGGNRLGGEQKRALDKYDQYGYLYYSVPWSFSINYSVNLVRDMYNIKKEGFDYKLMHDLSFNGSIQPTKNWSFQYNGNYNFALKKITSMTLNIIRDMHCWQITASAIPIGPMKSYTMTVAVKSSLLRDLKYDKQSTRRRDNLWY